MSMIRILVMLLWVFAGVAFAGDDTVLIQLQQDGRYVVWHSEGATNLSDEELTLLAASARPEGGDRIATSSGTAVAYEQPHAVLVVLAGAAADSRLLIDRDACGGVRIWHAEGPLQLTEDQLTDLVVSALPDGGRTIPVGDRYAKAYTMALGTVAVLWAPVKREKTR